MYIVIVGAGKLGYYLTKDLLSKGHEVTLVDWDYNRVQYLERELGEAVLFASGSSIDGLEKAGCSRADVIVAATGDDEDNLVICQLGKLRFHIPKAVARINNPKNEFVFAQLGVGTTISGTKSIADVIETYVLKKKMNSLLTFNQGQNELLELDIGPESPAADKEISQLGLPGNCILVMVIRGREIIYPRGYTRLEAGDMVIALTSSNDREQVQELLLGTGE